MEISSYQGDADGDIDIDLDSNYNEDDDQMEDDDAQHHNDAHNHHDDDLMVDDDAASHTADHTADREMQVDTLATTSVTAPAPEITEPPTVLPDEDLLDFSDDEDMNTYPTANTQPSKLAPEYPSAPTSDNEPVEQVQSEVSADLPTESVFPAPDSTSEEQEALPVLQSDEPDEEARQEHDTSTNAAAAADDSFTEEIDLGEAAPHDDLQDPQVEPPSVTERVENAIETNDESAQHDSAQMAAEESHHQPAEADDVVASTTEDAVEVPDHAAVLTVDVEATNVNVTDQADVRERQPNSPTVTGLHSTVVEYNGSEILLFPSSDTSLSSEYLLGNENLVTSSLGDLLQACRSVLGQSLSEDEELVLGVEELDLYVSEDSTPAFSISFSELLDVYLQLHRNDGNVSPPPFRVSLATKTRFTNRLNLITQAIAEGKGFSQLDFLQDYEFDQGAGFPEEEDFEDESYHDIDVGHDQDNNDQDHAQEGHIEGQDQEQAQEPQEEYQDYAENDESEYTAEHVDGRAEDVQPEVPATNSEDVHATTQYYDAEADQSFGQADEQHDEPPTAPAESTADDNLYGENALLDYYKQEDSGLTPDSASEHGETTLGHAGEAFTEGDAEQASSQPYEEHLDEDYFDEEEGEGEKEEEEAAPEQGAAYDDDGQEIANLAEVDVGEELEAANAPTVSQESEADQVADVDTNESAPAEVSGETFDEAFDEPVDSSAVPQEGHHGEDEAQNGATSTSNAGSAVIYDDEEIDFDEDDDLGREQSPAHETVPEAAATEASPSAKRTFSERIDTADASQDEQALKKARSS